jgi:single-strand DNA-binding protein
LEHIKSNRKKEWLINKLLITGNLVRDIDLKFSPGTGTAVLRNTVATRRKIKDKNTGNYESDFIPVVAFGKTAEFIGEHFSKGIGIQIEAHMQSGSYVNSEGSKIYTLEAVVDNVEFMGGKSNNNTNNSNQNEAFNYGNYEEDIMPIDDGDQPF